MVLRRRARIASVIFACLPLSAAYSAERLPADSNFKGIVREGTIVFVPHQSSANRGPVYFTQFREEQLKPTSSGDLKHLYVNLTPTAIRDGEYTAFENAHGIIPERVLPVPAFGECRPTQALIDYFALQSAAYRPQIVQSTGWPYLCTLSIYYFPEFEGEVMSLIASSHGISMSATIPLCAADSPLIDSPEIVRRLKEQRVLSLGSDGYSLIGNTWDVVYATSILIHEAPALYGTAVPSDGWASLMREFSFDASTETATLPGVLAQYPATACKPEPLHVQY